MPIDATKERKIYWGGIDNTIIPTMAKEKASPTPGEVKQAKEHTGHRKKSADETARERLEAKQLAKEQAAADKLHFRSQMKLEGLQSKFADLQDSIGKMVKVESQDRFKISREFKIQGLMMNNVVSNAQIFARLMADVSMTMDKVNKYLSMSSETFKEMDAHIESIISGHNGYLLNLQNEVSYLEQMTNPTQEILNLITEKKFRIEEIVEGQKAFNSILKATGNAFADIMKIQMKNVSLALDMARSYKEIGGTLWKDMTSEAETQLEHAETQRDILINETIPGLEQELFLMSNLVKLKVLSGMLTKEQGKDAAKFISELRKEHEDMTKAADSMVAAAERNLQLAKLQARIHGQIKASADAILGPFEKVEELLKRNWLTNWLVTLTGLDTQIKDFSETVRSELSKAFALQDLERFEAKWDPEREMWIMVNADGVEMTIDQFGELQNQGQDLTKSFELIKAKGLAAINSIGAALKSMNAMMAGMLGPVLAIIALFALAYMAMRKIYEGTLELRKELGLSHMEAAKLQSTINLTAAQFSFLGVEASDVRSVVTGIQDSMGGVGEVTDELLRSMTELNADFGIAGESAATLVTQMKAVGAASDQAAISQLESVSHLAKASGVAPAAIMDTVAGNTEAFAEYAKDGGKNVFKAAIAAKKLGIEFDSIASAAESLLDFETSIEASMEASMLLGRNINSDRARELALAGDMAGMTREITRQVGDQASWNKMNILQRKALAKAFGMTVADMGSMISNQDKLNKMTDGQKKHQDKINEVLKTIGQAWSYILKVGKLLLPVLVGIAAVVVVMNLHFFAMVAVVTAIGAGLGWLNEQVPLLGTGIGVIVGILTAWWIKQKISGAASLSNLWAQFGVEKLITTEKNKQAIADKAKGDIGVKKPELPVKGAGIPDTKSVPKKGIGDKLKDLAKGLKSMAGGKVLQGALNLIPTGLGFLLLLPGLPGLLIIAKAKLSKVGVNLKALAQGLKAMAGGKVALGALNMTLASAAFALAIVSIPFLGFIALAGTAVSAGLIALGAGLEGLGTAAATGLPFIAVGLIAALGVAMIPFGFALKLAAPFVTAIAEGLFLLSTAGAGLITLAVGIGALGLALAGWGAASLFIGIGVAMLSAFSLAMTVASKSAIKLENAMAGINTEMTETIKKREPYESVLEGFSKLVSPLKLIGRNLGESLWDGLGMAGLMADSPSRAGEKIQEGITAIMPGLLGSFGRLFDGISNIFSTLGGFFKGLWDGIGNAAKMAWGLIVNGAQWAWDGIKAGASWLWGKLKAGWAGLKEILAPAWEGIKAGASAAWEGIKAGASVAWEGIKAGWAGLKTGLSSVWSGIKSGGSAAWVGIKDGASQAWTGIKSGLDGLKSGATQAFAGIKDGAVQAWEGLKGSASVAAEKVKAVWASTAAPEVWDKAKNLANKAMTGVKDAASSAWSGIKGVFGFSEGGIVPTPGNRPQYFAEGSDVIPAALTPGEMVLTDKQQDTVGGAIKESGASSAGMDTKILEAKMDRLISAMESGNSQLSAIAGNTGEFVNTVVTS